MRKETYIRDMLTVRCLGWDRETSCNKTFTNQTYSCEKKHMEETYHIWDGIEKYRVKRDL